MKLCVIFTILILSLGSCNPQGPKRKVNKYFDLSEFFSHQVIMLDSINPQLMKYAKVDDKTAEETMRLDSAGWAKEMEIFKKLDINKPVLIDSYQIDTIYKDHQTILKYDAYDPEKVQVEYLHLYFNTNLNNLQQINAFYKEVSPLYKTRRRLHLHFQPMRTKVFLNKYQIEGQQKIVLKDTVSFNVTSEVIF